jgi:hypothetical protein
LPLASGWQITRPPEPGIAQTLRFVAAEASVPGTQSASAVQSGISKRRRHVVI